MTLWESHQTISPATAFTSRLGDPARGAPTSGGSSRNTAPSFPSRALPSPRSAERVARPPAGATHGGSTGHPTRSSRHPFRAGSFSSAATGRRMAFASSSVSGGRHLSDIALPPDYGRRQRPKALPCAGRIFGLEHRA
jgi:hypothetical protein